MPSSVKPKSPPIPRRGELVDLTIDDWGDRGRGIARLGRMVVLTDRGLPGDTVRARITRRKARHLEASVEEILISSPYRVSAPCRHFGLCGGCRLLDLDYDRQLDDKVRHMLEQVRRIGGVDSPPDVERVPCDPPYRYRNKMEFSFSGVAGQPILGLHPRGNFRDAFDLQECWLTDERAAQIVSSVRGFFADGPEEPHDPIVHTGFLRFLVVRFGRNTGDMLVNLVTAAEDWPRADEFGDFLKSDCPEVTTALWTINSSRANVAVGERRQLFFGTGQFRERLDPFLFEIAADGFFQTNTDQAVQLFKYVVDWAFPDGSNGSGGGEVLDLYSGAGAISLFLSRRASHVIGVESHPESVAAAVRNATANGVTNCEFVCSDTLDYLRARVDLRRDCPTVVADPPRVGLHPKVVKALVLAKPERIVYISCNTSALARDIALFGDSYHLTKLAAVDMFPHTPHIEAVALLERTSPLDDDGQTENG